MAGLSLGVSRGASAQTTPDQDLAAVRELVLHATYRDALTSLGTFLARTDLDAAHRDAGLEVRAIVQLALRDEAGARATLAELYARDPGHRLEDPDASPVVQSAFARARESAAPLTVELVDQTERAPATRGTPEVSVQLGAHGDVVAEVRIAYRRRGDARWVTAVATPEGGLASSPLAVSTSGLDAYEVEYHVEALAPSSAVVARLGTADAPLVISEPAGSAAVASGDATGGGVAPTDHGGGGGIESEPWLWILVGVAVVGAGVGVGLGVGLSQPNAENGSLDTIQLPLVRF
jgi:hypothetical protein